MKVNYNYKDSKKKLHKRKKNNLTTLFSAESMIAWWGQNYHYLNILFSSNIFWLLMSMFTRNSTICNFTLYWQFVPRCFSNIKITTTCNFRVNIFPSSPVLAGTIFSFELLSLVFTTVANSRCCQMNCFCKNWRKTALPARRGRYAQLAESCLIFS